jgi:hypothetical protein
MTCKTLQLMLNRSGIFTKKIATVKAKQKHKWPWATRAVAPLPHLVAASFSSSWEEGSSPLNGADMVISSICPTLGDF